MGLLAAHLLRAGLFILIPALLLMLPLLFVPRGWVARLWQLVLMASALEWVRMGVFEAAKREDQGAPWLRLVLILAAVALLAVVSALLFETETLERRYPRRPLY